MSDHHHHHGHCHCHSHDPENKLSWKTYIFRIVFSLLIIAIVLAYGMSYQVSEYENVVVTRFDRPMEPVTTEAGLHFKLPWPIDQVRVVDMRKRIYETPLVSNQTKDDKTVMLKTYMMWRVCDALKFIRAFGGDVEAAEKNLESSVVGLKNPVLGDYPMSALISTNGSEVKITEIEKRICDSVNEVLKDKDSGIEVLQIGIKRISLPETNMKDIVAKMRTNRGLEASKIAQKGRRDVEAITKQAEVDAQQIIAQGINEATKITQQADAEAMTITASVHQLDPEFYEFWKAMNTIQKTIGPRTTLILKHDSSVFSPIFQMPKWTKPSEATQANIQAAEQILNQSEEKISDVTPAP
ncbi:MAG: SPFH domain-containing protein [Thermoguttaceae bacterium]|nr:SPFH domain-containing protein [Thermoguttaceae bacterium]